MRIAVVLCAAAIWGLAAHAKDMQFNPRMESLMQADEECDQLWWPWRRLCSQRIADRMFKLNMYATMDKTVSDKIFNEKRLDIEERRLNIEEKRLKNDDVRLNWEHEDRETKRHELVLPGFVIDTKRQDSVFVGIIYLLAAITCSVLQCCQRDSPMPRTIIALFCALGAVIVYAITGAAKVGYALIALGFLGLCMSVHFTHDARPTLLHIWLPPPPPPRRSSRLSKRRM